MLRSFLLTVALSSIACAGAPATPQETTPVPPATQDGKPAASEPESPQQPAATQCAEAPTWRYEKIELPPEFAPSLPPGTEILWFAPGMFKPDADDYFTYAFSLDFEDATLDADALQTILVAYYEGLMKAVAEGQQRDAGPVKVDVQGGAGGQFSANIELTDEFTGGDEITLFMELDVKGTCVLAFATAKPSEDNAAALARTAKCLPCG